MNDTAGELPTALLPRLGLKPKANSQNHDQQVEEDWHHMPAMPYRQGFNPLPYGKAKPTTGLSC
jgi:hypothetical protein